MLSHSIYVSCLNGVGVGESVVDTFMLAVEESVCVPDVWDGDTIGGVIDGLMDNVDDRFTDVVTRSVDVVTRSVDVVAGSRDVL